MAASDSAFPASVPPMPPVSQSSRFWFFAMASGDLFRESVGRARNSAGDGFAKNEKVGIEILGARVSSRPGTNGVSFIDDEQCAGFFGELPQSLDGSPVQDARCPRWS